MVKKKKFDEVFVSMPVTVNSPLQQNFGPVYSSLESNLRDTLFVAKQQLLFLCIFSCLMLFALSWLVSSNFYLLFVPACILSAMYILSERKAYLIKKDFDENGIF